MTSWHVVPQQVGQCAPTDKNLQVTLEDRHPQWERQATSVEDP